MYKEQEKGGKNILDVKKRENRKGKIFRRRFKAVIEEITRKRKQAKRRN